MLPASAKIPGTNRALTRRDLLRAAFGVGLAHGVVACGRAPRIVEHPVCNLPEEKPPRAPLPPFVGPVVLWSWFDLPEDARSRELSGITWDAESSRLFAVQDETANIVSLVPTPDLRSWSFGPVTRIDTAAPLDLEGIAAVPGGFVVCSEIGARILEVDREGHIRREIALPRHFQQARANKSLESMSVSPSKRVLFTTSESALDCDGLPASEAAGTRVRIVRIDRTTGDLSEHAYRSERAQGAAGDYGIADVAAMSDDELLVLERGWVPGRGNTVRVFRTSLGDDAAACTGAPALSDATPVVAKTLLVDLGDVVARDVPPSRQPQSSNLLDNFEGMAIGPVLPDGRSTLLLVSDDNARADQVARVVVLAFGS